jgi:type II secretory pathway component PulJ
MWASLATGVLARPWARRVAGFALVALTIALFLLNLRRQGERAGRAAERLDHLERTHAIHRQMLDAAARRPRDRDDLLDRLREGGF